MDREQLLSQWREEAARGMSGWDFSPHPGPLHGGDFALGLSPGGAGVPAPQGCACWTWAPAGASCCSPWATPYELTTVTEGWEPNLALCQKKLAPLGITVKYYDSEKGVAQGEQQLAPAGAHVQQAHPGAQELPHHLGIVPGQSLHRAAALDVGESPSRTCPGRPPPATGTTAVRGPLARPSRVLVHLVELL